MTVINKTAANMLTGLFVDIYMHLAWVFQRSDALISFLNVFWYNSRTHRKITRLTMDSR